MQDAFATDTNYPYRLLRWSPGVPTAHIAPLLENARLEFTNPVIECQDSSALLPRLAPRNL